MAKMSDSSGNSNKKVVSLPKSANKAISNVKQSAANLNSTTTSKPASTTKSPSKSLSDLADSITQRYRVTAREARDIVTAVGTHISNNKGVTQQDNWKMRTNVPASTTAANIKKQVKETITAAKTGKAGTSSDKISNATNASDVKKGNASPKYNYNTGKQR